MSHKNVLVVPELIKQALGNPNTFDALMQLQGKAFRDVKGRKTIQVQLAGKSYFLKQHFGVTNQAPQKLKLVKASSMRPSL